MSENGINKKISLDSAFKGPSLKPVNSNLPKLPETNQASNNSYTKDNNLAFTIAGLNGASTKEQLQISASKQGVRSGPAGLTSKSASYELPSWDNDDYGENSFNIT